MQILASNHSTYPRIGDDPSQQILRFAYSKWERGELGDEDFERVQDEVTKEVIKEQVRAGLEVVTDGQIRWHDPVSHIAGKLDGCKLNGLLRFFDTNFYFRQPIVEARPTRKEPVLKREFKFAMKISSKPLKAVITGPYTITKLSINRSNFKFEQLLMEFVKVVSEEIADLARAGAELVQIEEPAILKNAQDWDLFSGAVEELANAKDNAILLLCTYFGNAAPLLPRFLELPVDGLGLDFTYSPELPNVLLGLGCAKDLALGVVDGRNTRMESCEEVLGILERILPGLESRRVYVMPSCGVGDYLPRDVAFRKLQRIAEIARAAREML